VVNGTPCRRRVGMLYLPPSASYYGCRNCHELTYTSCQRSHEYDSLWRRIAKDTGRDFRAVKRGIEQLFKRTT
jgi:hypothetical protein